MGDGAQRHRPHFFWITGIVLDPEREVGFWLATPLIAVLGFSMLRSLGGYSDLRGNIQQVSVGTVEDGTEIVSVWLAIRNLGARPSAATHWRIHVRVADSTITSDIVPIQFGGSGVQANLDEHAAVITFPNSEFMHNKGSNGIAGGGYIAGVLIGDVPEGIAARDILRAGSKVSVTFQDIQGRELAAEHIMTGVTGGQKWIPGIDAAINPVVQPAKKPQQLPSGTRAQRRRAGRKKKGGK